MAVGGTLGAAPVAYNFSDAHSIYSANNGTAARRYVADLSMRDVKKLTGNASAVAASSTLSGIHTDQVLISFPIS